MERRLKKGRVSEKRKWLFSLFGLCLMAMALPDTVHAQTDGGNLSPGQEVADTLSDGEERKAENGEALTVSGQTVSGSVVPVQYMARTAGDVTEYEIWVKGVQVTSRNADNVLAGDPENDGKVKYNPDTGILTLDGANIVCEAREEGSLRSERDALTVQLLNQNAIKNESVSGYPMICAVFSKGDLTFCGDGSVEIACQPDITSGRDRYAIKCEGNFELQSGTVSAIVGNYTKNTSAAYTTQAVAVSKAVRITGGKLTARAGRATKKAQSAAIMTTERIEISNAEVIAESGEGLHSFGIYTNAGLDIRNSSVSFTSGRGSGGSIAVACQNGSKLTVNDSNVTAVSGEADGNSTAIVSTELELNNSSIEAKGGTSTGGGSWGLSIGRMVLHNSGIATESGSAQSSGNSVGAWSEKVELNDNSSVTAKGGTSAGGGSWGLSIDKLLLNNSTITAESDTGNYSTGIWCSELEINNGTMTAKGRDAITESDGLSAAAFKFNGGSVRAEAGGAADWSVGLWTNNLEISGGTLVAIAGQADGINAITLTPSFVNGYKVIVKAGNSEADADIIASPTDETYWGNAYVSIEPHSHIHTWSNTWTFDDAHHWHVCTGEDCGITDHAQLDAYGEHAYDNDKDADCNVCGAKRTVPSEPDAPSYQILDGANGEWMLEEEGSLKIRGSGDFAKFEGVKVDGDLLAKENYEVQPGSTIVTLKAAYLNTLAEGSHNFEMLWTDGAADTVFTIAAKNSGNGGNSGETGGTGSGGNNGGTGETGSSGNNSGADGTGNGSHNGGAGGSSTDGGSGNVSAGSNSGTNTGSVPISNIPTADGNKKDNVPKTGDDTSYAWIWAMLAASGAGIFLTGKGRKTIRR